MSSQYAHLSDYQLIELYNSNRNRVFDRLQLGHDTINGNHTRIMNQALKEIKRRKLGV